MNPCEYNLKMQQVFVETIQPNWFANDFVCAMLQGQNSAWRDNHMRTIAALLVEVFRIDLSDERSMILTCLRELNLVDPYTPSDPNTNPTPNTTPLPAMTKDEEDWYCYWNCIGSAIRTYMSNTGHRSTGQGVNEHIRRKDSCDAIMFVAMTCLPPFLAWFANATKDNPNSPKIVNKDRFLSFVKHDLEVLVKHLIQGSKANMADIGDFVAEARATYFRTVGVWTPEEEQAEQFDPFAHTRQPTCDQ